MNKSEHPNARGEESADTKRPRHGDRASGDKDSPAPDKANKPSEPDMIAELGDELGGPA